MGQRGIYRLLLLKWKKSGIVWIKTGVLRGLRRGFEKGTCSLCRRMGNEHVKRILLNSTESK
jgi:hypothetical protein